MVEAILQVKDIETRLDNQWIHRGVSFAVPAGTITAIIGGSGSGKSVLLKEILGLLKPTSGTITLFGQNVWESSEAELQNLRRRYGVLFQNGALFSALNVEDNIAVPLREQTQLSDELILNIVELRLALSGLSADAALKMPSDLSGGMRKRVALARAMALEPEILFLDEPTSGLDPINARAFDQLIRTLCDSLGLTVIIVTHDLDTLAGIVDVIVVLGEGKVLAQGSVKEVAKSSHPWIRDYFAARAQ